MFKNRISLLVKLVPARTIVATALAVVFLSSGMAVSNEPLSTFKDCDECPKMVILPQGKFIMGATKKEQKHMFIGHVAAEHPAHQVTISYTFAIGRYEITTDEFAAFAKESKMKIGGTCGIRLMEKGPLARKFKGTRHPDSGKVQTGPFYTYITDGSFAQPGLPISGRQPAVCVSRREISGYLDWLNAKTGRNYRLPSEAEWEYAARAGTKTIGFWGNSLSKACAYANFGDKKSGYQAGMIAPCAESISPSWSAEVGSYKPNPWGLHDMSGNVQELTADCWHDTYQGAPDDGSVWAKPDCSLYVARGGDYELMHISMRASERLFYGYVEGESAIEGKDAGNNGRSNVMGFRIAVSLK